MFRKYQLLNPMICDQGDAKDDDSGATIHTYSNYDDVDSKWMCRICNKVSDTPPGMDGMLHCECGGTCQMAPKVTNYYVHGGQVADFWCPICESFISSVVNDSKQVECEMCDIWLDLSV